MFVELGTSFSLSIWLREVWHNTHPPPQIIRVWRVMYHLKYENVSMIMFSHFALLFFWLKICDCYLLALDFTSLHQIKWSVTLRIIWRWHAGGLSLDEWHRSCDTTLMAFIHTPVSWHSLSFRFRGNTSYPLILLVGIQFGYFSPV
jgi:hypothetical protein